MQTFHNPTTGNYFDAFYSAGTEQELQDKMAAHEQEMKPKGFTVVKARKVGRNEPCPCGSGVKFKKCCLQHAR